MDFIPLQVLVVLKNDKLKDLEKKKEIELLLGPIADERFALLVNLGKKITDFNISTSAEGSTEIDETYGINVQFEESSEEDDEDAYGEVGDIEWMFQSIDNINVLITGQKFIFIQ